MCVNHHEILDQQHFEEQYQFVAPAAALSDMVEFYWQLDLRKAMVQGNQFAERIFANLNVSMVFNLGSPFLISHGDQQEQLGSSVIIGHHTKSLTYTHLQHNFLLGVKFKPAGINLAFGVSASELNNGMAEISSFLKEKFVEEQLYEADSFHKQTVLLNRLLTGYLRRQEGQSFKIQLVKAALNKDLAGSGSIEKMAAQLHITKRSLQRYFMQELGLSPGQCLQVLRFRKALQVYSKLGYAADYEELGYCDFSHFMKDYKRYTAI